ANQVQQRFGEGGGDGDGAAGVGGVVGAVEVEDLDAGLTGDGYAGHGVPGLVGEHDHRVEVAGRDPGQGGGRRTDHADALHLGEQEFGQRQPLDVVRGRVGSDRIVADGNQCVAQLSATAAAA